MTELVPRAQSINEVSQEFLSHECSSGRLENVLNTRPVLGYTAN